MMSLTVITKLNFKFVLSGNKELSIMFDTKGNASDVFPLSFFVDRSFRLSKLVTQVKTVVENYYSSKGIIMDINNKDIYQIILENHIFSINMLNDFVHSHKSITNIFSCGKDKVEMYSLKKKSKIALVVPLSNQTQYRLVHSDDLHKSENYPILLAPYDKISYNNLMETTMEVTLSDPLNNYNRIIDKVKYNETVKSLLLSLHEPLKIVEFEGK